MSADVIAFPEKEDPHVTGPAICACCKHEWVAVAPVGEWQLECPACHTEKGLFKYPVRPPKIRWVCSCGNDLFYMSPESAQCFQCGEIQEF